MRRLIVGTGAAALALGMGVGTAHAATPAWRVTQTTKLPGDDILSDVTVAPTGSTWAVGKRTVSGKTRPVVQRLSGTTWKDVKLPAGWSMALNVVDASSSKNVWAFSAEEGSVVHWNGKKWTSAKFTGVFRATDAGVVSASNVWAVNGGTTARHWNGKKWASVKLPAHVVTLQAVSAKNIWAAGSIGDKAAVVHYDGRSWKVVKTVALAKPEPDAATVLTGIAVSGKNVWAVGAQSWSCGEDGDDTCYTRLALRLTGTKSKSFVTEKGQAYTKVAADGSGGVWILQGAWDPALVHVTGDTFTSSAAPRPSGHDVNLTALVNRPGTKTVWSVGGSSPEGDPDDPTSDGVYLRTG
ncbi:hypothetical protein [Actinoallomurus soli]|uniref:hypothetical protein n=1 Tax=Actinoallomurus soli TaxID=2952535 RepID=UPI002092685F|nr:hypothetical protein [Actinoallomurus soli]MCO5972974.1 hypothetical protein [Actinoallomurus soli]